MRALSQRTALPRNEKARDDNIKQTVRKSARDDPLRALHKQHL